MPKSVTDFPTEVTEICRLKWSSLISNYLQQFAVHSCQACKYWTWLCQELWEVLLLMEAWRLHTVERWHWCKLWICSLDQTRSRKRPANIFFVVNDDNPLLGSFEENLVFYHFLFLLCILFAIDGWTQSCLMMAVPGLIGHCQLVSLGTITPFWRNNWSNPKMFSPLLVFFWWHGPVKRLLNSQLEDRE